MTWWNERDRSYSRDERGPTLAEIQAERDPRHWQVIEEGKRLEKEMQLVQACETSIFLRTQPMERARLQAVLEVRKREAMSQQDTKRRTGKLAS